jgi:ribokinase
MRVAVVGNVEWVEFACVEHVPAAGEIVHARETFAEPAGGGAVAAAWLARLAGQATLFTALGDDPIGARSRDRLGQLGVRVEAALRQQPTRRAVTFIDDRGERTITTLGERLQPQAGDDLPWAELAGMDAVYFTAGDAASLAAARAARVVVASPRARAALVGVALDALVLSANDSLELATAMAAEPPPRLVVETRGAAGGTYRSARGEGAWRAAPLPGPLVDAYGCGDAFAAAFTYALGRGDDLDTAVSLAARCGAECLTLRGPYGLSGRRASRAVGPRIAADE